MAGFFDSLTDGIYHYIDLIWVPVAWFTAPERHRRGVMAFVLTCIATLRTQVELMESTGFDTGFLPFMHSNVYARGVIIYGIVIALFLGVAHYSQRTEGEIFFAAGLTIYIMAFCASMLLMAL